jgi:histidinol-phosphate aminotransferase
MENPYRLPESTRVELGRRLAEVAINRYPGPAHKALKAAIAHHLGVPADLAMVLGNGSDELIQLLALAVAKPGAVIMAPAPGFVMVEISARLAGVEFVGVPLAADFSLDLPALLAAIAQHRPALLYLAYPNNPTGNCFDPAAIETVIRAAPGLVISDEAYQPFARDSWMPRVAQFDNLLVMRTVSKLGLAGLRLGYLAGPARWIDEIDKIRPPYNVNVLTEAAAQFALEHHEELEQQARQLVIDRDRLMVQLAALAGVQTFPSRANFVLVRVPDASAVNAALRTRKVLVRDVSGMHPLLANCLRLTVGTALENKLLLEALGQALASK